MNRDWQLKDCESTALTDGTDYLLGGTWPQLDAALAHLTTLSATIPAGYVAPGPMQVTIQVFGGDNTVVNFGVQQATPTPTLTNTPIATPS